MNINSINTSDIKRYHRVEAKNQSADKPRAILVEFTNVSKRSEVLKQRKLLKNSIIKIQEDLTQTRLKLLQSAIAKFTTRNAWCLHGNVYVKSGVVLRVNDECDIQRLKI